MKNNVRVIAKPSRFGARHRSDCNCYLVGVHSPCNSSRISERSCHEPCTGTFDVKLTPQTDDKGDPALGRMTIDKQFHGDLEGTSKGQMLTGMTEVKGSAGYVAIEKVTGTLKGRSGSFILHTPAS